MSYGIAPDEFTIHLQVEIASHEERAQRAHRDYARSYSAWIHCLEEQAADGNKSARAELNELKLLSKGKRGDEKPAGAVEIRLAGAAKTLVATMRPMSLAIRRMPPIDRTDPREAIVDFESRFRFGIRTIMRPLFRRHWFGRQPRPKMARPIFMQMGARWLAIFQVMRPQLIGEMRLRLPPTMIVGLRAVLNARDPLETGRFFRKPLALVRKCTSLLQLGKRGYSAIYVLRGDLIGSATCAAIGALDNKSRQAANKPIQEFRDTFRGMKSLPMRDKETRKKCKKAQEKN